MAESQRHGLSQRGGATVSDGGHPRQVSERVTRKHVVRKARYLRPTSAGSRGCLSSGEPKVPRYLSRSAGVVFRYAG